MRNAVDIFLRTPARIYCFADTVVLCRTLLDAGARVIQFRHKTADDAAFASAAREMLDCVRSYDGAVLIVNDRVEIALDIGADGIFAGI
jgi:thiamine monophosphate synthase